MRDSNREEIGLTNSLNGYLYSALLCPALHLPELPSKYALRAFNLDIMHLFIAMVLFFAARLIMRREDNRQIFVMLATSFLILCVLHPYPGFFCTGLESLFYLILLFVVILFAKQVAALCDLVLASALCFAGFVFIKITARRLLDDVSADTFSIGDPLLPFRFQLPPPALSA